MREDATAVLLRVIIGLTHTGAGIVSSTVFVGNSSAASPGGAASSSAVLAGGAVRESNLAFEVVGAVLGAFGLVLM